jgi:hypothetical protein
VTMALTVCRGFFLPLRGLENPSIEKHPHPFP